MSDWEIVEGSPTGRMSRKEPLSQLLWPIHKPSPLLRSAVVPFKLIQTDYGEIEKRILAYMGSKKHGKQAKIQAQIGQAKSQDKD